MDDAVETGFGQAQFLQEFGGFFGVEFGDFGFDGGADRDHVGAFRGGEFSDYIQMRIVFETVFGDVGDIQHRLGGDQMQFFQPAALVSCISKLRAWLPFLDMRLHRCMNANLALASLSLDLASLPARSVWRSIDSMSASSSSVLMVSMSLSGSMVADVHDIVVFKAAHDLGNGVGFADMAEKLVAQSFALRGACDEAGNVDKFHRRRHDFFRLHDIGELLQARVRHFDYADVRIDRTKRIVFRGDTCPGQRIEQG